MSAIDPVITQYRGLRLSYYRWRLNAGAVTMLLLSFMMCCFTGVMAQITVYLPWTPVPLTGQTLAVLIAGIVLGGRWGAMSQALYIAIGLAGVPWFAGGRGGAAVAMGPTFGYIAGFVVTAYLVGFLVERYKAARRLLLLTVIMIAANFIIILGLGTLYLHFWLMASGGQAQSFTHLLYMSAVPFIPGAIVKTVLAAVIGTAMLPKGG
jgi:biotin transport system substrate-specific component